MSTKFLDNAGLSYFYLKIKNYFNSLLSTKANDVDVVHKTGNELIEGTKTFSNSNVSDNNDWDGSSVYIRLPNYDKGTIPDKHYVGNLIFMDKDGTDIDHNGRLGILELAEYPNGINVIRLGVYKNEVTNGVDSDEFSLFGIGYDANGNQYAYGPSTSPLRQSGNDIVTRDWLPKDTRLVHTLVDDTIESVKIIKHTETISSSGHTVTSGLLIKVDASKSDSLPSSHKFSSITFIDKNATSPWIRDSDANRFAAVEHAIRTNGDADIKLVLNIPRIQTTEAISQSSMGLYYDRTHDAFYSFLQPLRNLSFEKFGSGNGNHIIVNDKSINTMDAAPAQTTIDNIIICQDSQGHWFSTLQSGFFKPNGEVTTFFTARNYVNNVLKAAQVTLGVSKAGDMWFSGPSTLASRTDGTDILTRDWIPKDTRIVHTTDNETIGGDKTFTGAVNINTYIDMKKASFARGTAPNENKTFGSFNVLDSNSNPVTRIYTWYYTSKFIQSGLLTYNGTNTDHNFTGIFVGFDENGLPFANTTSTRTDRTHDGDILTRDWIPKDTRIVHTTGNEVVAGEKTFNDPIRSSRSDTISQTVTNSYLSFSGGIDHTGSAGGKLYLFGKDNSTNPGQVALQSVGGRRITLESTRLTSSFDYFDFTNNGFLRCASGNHSIRLFAGLDNQDGASLQLFGYNATNYTGNFYLRACTKSGASSTTGSACDLAGNSTGTLRWNGQPIQTSSDERLKQDFSSIPDNILDAWLDVDWMQFKFKQAVQEKGDNARTHAGLVAQRVKAVFEKHGIDGCTYGILCHDFHEASTYEEKIVDTPEYVDDNGILHNEVYHMEEHSIDAEDLWTIRYVEALCMEASCMRRENNRLKAKIVELEERISNIETLLKLK